MYYCIMTEFYTETSILSNVLLWPYTNILIFYIPKIVSKEQNIFKCIPT